MECYRQLFAIRRDNPELFEEGVATTVACNVNDWDKGRYITLKSGDKALYLVVNPQVSASADVTMYGASATQEYQLMSCSYNVTPKRNGTTVTLPAGAYAVYGTMNLVDAPVVEADGNGVDVHVENGCIVVDGDYEQVYVYNMSGRRINFDRRLPVGVYIVVVDGHAGKVVVR